jgi:hypothetical protein
MADVQDEARAKLDEALDAEGEFYVSASSGDGGEPKYRGPSSKEGIIGTVLTWARGAFAGMEARIATARERPEPDPETGERPAQEYDDVVTVTAGGPGEAPTVGSTAKRSTAKRSTTKKATS